MRTLCTVYQLGCDRCRVIENGVEVVGSLSARWVEPRADSSQVRQEVIEQVGRRIAAIHLGRDRAWIDVLSVASSQFAGESEVSLSFPVKEVLRGRAKVSLVLIYESQEDVELCFSFEDKLDLELQEREVGYVEGNDIGGGEFRLFCLGTRKRSLREAIEQIASSELTLRWSIGG